MTCLLLSRNTGTPVISGGRRSNNPDEKKNQTSERAEIKGLTTLPSPSLLWLLFSEYRLCWSVFSSLVKLLELLYNLQFPCDLTFIAQHPKFSMTFRLENPLILLPMPLEIALFSKALCKSRCFFFIVLSFLALLCSLRDLSSLMRDETPGPGQWKHPFLITGSPGKSQIKILLIALEEWCACFIIQPDTYNAHLKLFPSVLSYRQRHNDICTLYPLQFLEGTGCWASVFSSFLTINTLLFIWKFDPSVW